MGFLKDSVSAFQGLSGTFQFILKGSAIFHQNKDVSGDCRTIKNGLEGLRSVLAF